MYGRDCTYAYLKFIIAATGEEYKYCTGNSTKEPITATSNVTITYFIYSYNFIFSNFNLNYEIENTVCSLNDSFLCSDGTCIPRHKVCDGVEDCVDGEDEKGCDDDPDNETIEGVLEIRQRAISWLKEKYKAKSGWGEDTHRTLVALSLSGAINFNGKDWKEMLMAKEIDVQTSMALLRNCSNPSNSLSPDQLSMLLHAFLATCRDPRNFHGIDLVQLIKNGAKAPPISTLPTVYLALCNANESLPEDAVDTLLKILNSSSTYPFILDVNAVAVMALSCLKHSKKESHRFSNTTVVTHFDEAIERFKTLQTEDGSFGNVYTTALVTQALVSAGQIENKDWRFDASVKFLMQWLNSSSINFLSTYLTLPILSKKSLTDIARIQCDENKDRNENDIRNKLGPKMLVEYSLYVGDKKDVIHTIFLTVPVNATAYEIMEVAAEVDPKYKFQSRKMSQDMYVYEIANIPNDPETGKFWLLHYISPFTAGQPVHSTDSPDQFVMQDGEHLIMWYKTANIYFYT